MRILAAHDGLGCGFVRVVQPLRELAGHGHEVTFTKTADTRTIELLRDGGQFDVILGQRFLGYEGMSMWRRARTPSNRLVYEVDDNLFDIDKSNWSAYQQYMNDDVIREAMQGYVMTADLMTVTTQALAQVQRDELGARNVAVLPNCVPEFVLEMKQREGRRPRVGWCGGASHGVDVHEAVPGVRRFMHRNPEWDLFIGGTDYRPSFRTRNWNQMIHEPWIPVHDHEREYYEMLDFDIGIVPVRDTAFGRSKSALKALEFNARGIPVIASDIEPYREYVVHGENGFLVKEQHEWGRYLNMLAKDEGLRREMGAKGRQHAAACTWEGNWQRWEKAYEGLFA